MSTSLTHEQQLERFGMTWDAAQGVLERAKAQLSPQVIAAGRKAWPVLAYELRGGKGQPFQCPRHPEAVRFHMVLLLLCGDTVEGATEGARAYAWTKP
jgi:hypothetical protein